MEPEELFHEMPGYYQRLRSGRTGSRWLPTARPVQVPPRPSAAVLEKPQFRMIEEKVGVSAGASTIRDRLIE